MSSICPEPRILGSKLSNFHLPAESYIVDNFFKNSPAFKWSLRNYVNEIVEAPNSDLSFEQLLTNFIECLENTEYFDDIVENVDLSYIGREEEPILAPPTVVNRWDLV
ncbi:hypothetical protein F8M41_006967 [Gigaspora margarita]|uniref:Uncharacterized protein n=1 Tax=Gigaspora margarita TaxID=4874 RepID=A0A8H4A5N2_GIGMA|nr:hypothetical protein F8M41_006967 [Gigaspora margarita]